MPLVPKTATDRFGRSSTSKRCSDGAPWLQANENRERLATWEPLAARVLLCNGAISNADASAFCACATTTQMVIGLRIGMSATVTRSLSRTLIRQYKHNYSYSSTDSSRIHGSPRRKSARSENKFARSFVRPSRADRWNTVVVVWLNSAQATPQSAAPPTDASPRPVRHLTKTTQHRSGGLLYTRTPRRANA